MKIGYLVCVLVVAMSLSMPLHAHAETYELYNDNMTGDGVGASMCPKRITRIGRAMWY